MDNSNVGSNKPKSATKRAAKFSSTISSSSAFSITKASSLVVMMVGSFEIAGGVANDCVTTGSTIGFGKLSKLISEDELIVGFNASLLISNWEVVDFK